MSFHPRENLPRIGVAPLTPRALQSSARIPSSGSAPLSALISPLTPRASEPSDHLPAPTLPRLYAPPPSAQPPRVEAKLLPNHEHWRPVAADAHYDGSQSTSQVFTLHRLDSGIAQYAPMKQNSTYKVGPASNKPQLDTPGVPPLPITSPLPVKPSVKTTSNVSAPSSSFQSMVNDVIQHSSFSLVFKKVHEVSYGQNISVPGHDTRLRTVNGDMQKLRAFAERHGIEEACTRSKFLDVFLAALLAALDSLKKNPPSGPVLSTLHATIVACGEPGAANRAAAVAGGCNNAPGILKSWRPPFSSAGLQTAPGPRPKLSAKARGTMEKWFREHYKNPYPTDADKLELARICGIQLNQVNNFFGNKRMRMKRKAMSMASAAGDTIGLEEPVDAGSVLAPRAKWRAVVLKKIPNAPGTAIADQVSCFKRKAVNVSSDYHLSEQPGNIQEEQRGNAAVLIEKPQRQAVGDVVDNAAGRPNKSLSRAKLPMRF